MQPKNDDDSIDATDDGIVICLNDVHFSNALFLIVVTDEGIDIFINEEHPQKALLSIFVIDDRILISFIVVFCSNILYRICSLSPSIVSLLTPLKILEPNFITDEGIVI